MADSFNVGEIAIYCDPNVHLNASYNGQECTIDSPLEWRMPRSQLTGKLVPTYGYKTIARDGRIFTCRPDQLRKKRPPQDWVKLCNLQESPRELETA